MGLCHALLIIEGFGMLVGRSVVSASGRCLWMPSLMSCCYSFSILQDLPVRCLLGNFLFGTVLLGLLVKSLVGLCQFLVMLLAWRVRPSRKTPAHLLGLSMHARPRVWNRLHCSGYYDISGVDCKRRRCDQHGLEDSPVRPRTGRLSSGERRPTSPGLHG